MCHVWDPDDALNLLCEWIRIDTCNPPGNEQRLALAIRSFLERWDIPAQVRELGHCRSNVLAVLPGRGSKKLMFSGHMDTVAGWSAAAGKYSPHGAVAEGGRIYGRGASDMKSGLAAMLLAMVSLKRDGIPLDGDLMFLATAGEEVDSCGARAYVQEAGVRGLDAVVIGEPTGCRAVIGHKGALWLRLAAYGTGAHASMPETGINAVEAMLEAADRLRREVRNREAKNAVLGGSSLAVTKINGGVQTNVVPDYCELEADIRFVPPLNALSLYRRLSAKLSEWSGKRDGIRLEIMPLLMRNPVLTPASDPVVRHALDIAADSGDSGAPIGAVAYYTDGSVLQSGGRPPVLLYGPGEPHQAHRPDEWVAIEAYLKAIGFYRELALRFLGTSG